MCLPVRPFRVEREWEHRGLQCAVTQQRQGGHRCGYVRVPPGHPLHGDEGRGLLAHGGVNFAELEPCEHEDGTGWWFGFDCSHAWDMKYDPEVDPKTLQPEAAEERAFFFEFAAGLQRELHFWTKAEVEILVEFLAEQLADAETPA